MIKNIHTRINDILSLILILLISYIILWPFWPNLTWFVSRDDVSAQVVASSLDEAVERVVIPNEKRLIIPEMGFSELVHEGADESVLKNGLWRRPNTSSPDKDSNTVIVGHRFTYGAEAAIFYHLDKLKVGDDISLNWNQKQYQYQVTRVRVVLPSEVSVEAATERPMLTLYTCTPLWSVSHRLVVETELKSIKG